MQRTSTARLFALVADGAIPVDWRVARALLPGLADRLALILRDQPDLRRPVPGLRWDASDVVAHLVTQVESFARFAARERSPAEDLLDGEAVLRPAARVARVNDRLSATVGDRAPGVLAERLKNSVRSFLDASASCTGGEEFQSWEGSFDVANAGGVLVGELAVHGLDVARAIRRPWYIARDEAIIALSAAANLLPDYIDPQRTDGVDLVFAISFRGGTRLGIHVHDGSATVSRGRPLRADCRISADPATFLLVAFGRLSPLLAAARLRVVAYGRRPWLSLTFSRLFDAP